MTAIALYLLQMMVASALLYGYYHFALRNSRFHQYNRFYLLAAFVISILVPFLNIPVYFSSAAADRFLIVKTLTKIYAGGSEPDATGIVVHSVPSTAWISWQSAAMLIYGVVAVAVAVRVIISLNRIRLLIRKNLHEEIGTIHFVNTDEPDTPFSFFRWLFWNRQISLESDKGAQIFRHELFHIRQKHSWDIVFIETAMVLFWINPIFHLLKKEVKAIHEFLADQFAARESTKWEYAELLLMQALGTRQQLVNPFFHNQIKRRIAMITNPQKTSHRYMRKLLVLPVAIVVIGLFAFSYKSVNDNGAFRAVRPLTVVIDAGHGGTDAGVTSPDGKFSEAGITLAISQQIQKWAKEYNIHVVMTRTDNHFPGNTVTKQDAMRKRIQIADQAKADAFIAIHVNESETARGATNQTGFEAFISGKRKDEKGELLASAILSNLSGLYSTLTELKQRSDTGVFVLDHAASPAVLLECGYMNNPADLAFITDKSNQEKIARRILEAIVSYSQSAPDGRTTATTPVISLARDGSAPDKDQWKLIMNNKSYQLYHLKQPIMDGEKIDASEWYGRPGPNSGPDTIGKPLLIIDGVLRKDLSIQQLDKELNPSDIESLSVLKGADAIAKYGKKAKDGALVITTRKKDGTHIVPKKDLDTLIVEGDKVFDKVEVEAAFPGGDTAWRNFLMKEVRATTPSDSGAPAGQYTVLLQFIVRTDGSITDLKAITHNGYGMEKEAVRAMEQSPKWIPGTQNGYKVNVYRKQPITFVIVEEGDQQTVPAGNKASPAKHS